MAEKQDTPNPSARQVLKPCPFCGFKVGRDNVKVMHRHYGSEEYAVVSCGQCGARGSFPNLPAHWSEESGALDTRCVDEAIVAWNRRAGDAT